MSLKFNIFTGNFDLVNDASTTTWLTPVANRAALPSGDTDGAARVVLDEDTVFVYDNGADTWYNTRLSPTAFSAAANAAGVSINQATAVGTPNITDYNITLHAADASNPGGVSTGTQTFAGDKTFNNNVIVTGDFTVNGTTTTINTATHDVEDANITVNKNGNQATANTQVSGITTEMSDATDARIGYDSTAPLRYKAGEVGSEDNIVGETTAQTLTNKTMNAANNTFSNFQHGSEVDNPSSGVHGVTGNVVGTTDNQTLQNKTIDGTSATGNNNVSIDAADAVYDNSTSGLTATDTQAAIDEVEGRVDTAETDISNHLSDAVDAHDASAISYDNTTSGLTAIETQAAIDEVEGRVDSAETGLSNHLSDAVDAHDASAISYDNSTSGLTATETQAAIDEVEGRLDTVETDTSNKADTDLGNLTIPTAINAGLLPDSDFGRQIGGTGTDRWDSINAKTIVLGSHVNALISVDTTSSFGNLKIGTTNSVIPPQAAFGAGVSIQNETDQRLLYFSTANHTAADANNSGDLILETGNLTNAGATGKSGDVVFRTGSNAGSGVRGSIRLVDESILTASNGYVLTLTDQTSGKAEWVAAPTTDISGKADTDLGNITTITSDLLPTTGLYDLGGGSNRWADLHVINSTFYGTMTVGNMTVQGSGTTPSGQSVNSTINTLQNFGIYTGNRPGATASSLLNLETGNQTGTALTGNILIKTGNASGNDSGNITIQTGAASGTRGIITLDASDVNIPGKLTVVGGIDPAYLQLDPQTDNSGVPNNSIFVDSNDSNKFKFKDNSGSISDVSSGVATPESASYPNTQSALVNGVSGSHADITYNDTYFGKTQDISIFALIKITETTGLYQIFSHWNADNDRRSWLLAVRDGKLEVFLDPTGDQLVGAKQYQSTANVADGNWHQVGFTWAANDLKLYVDSVELVGGAINKLVDSSFNDFYDNDVDPLRIGGIIRAADTFAFDGYIDQIAYYSDVLTPLQIAELYNNSFVNDYTQHSASANLEELWKMDGDSGSTITGTINSQDATISTGVTFSTDTAPGMTYSDLVISTSDLDFDTKDTIIKTGASTLGTRGDVVLDGNQIKLKDGSEGNSGDILTSSGNDGEMQWQSPTANKVIVNARRNTTTQTINNATDTTFIANIEEKDTHSAYNNTTGIFTAPKTASYLVSTFISLSNTTSWAETERINVFTTTNGTTIQSNDKFLDSVNGLDATAATSSMAAGGTAIIELQQGDTLQIRINQNSGVNLSTLNLDQRSWLTINSID